MKQYLFVLTFLLVPLLLLGQDNDLEIQGTVIDNETEIPILGANIIEKNTDNGVSTDENGEFTINVPRDATLSISYVGYAPQEIEVSEMTLDDLENLQIRQVPEEEGLDE